MVNSAFDVDREIGCLIAWKLLVPLKLVSCWSPDGQRVETNSGSSNSFDSACARTPPSHILMQGDTQQTSAD